MDDVADQLYGLRPEDFTAARKEQAAAARKGGDRELAGQISELRRPSLSAWASNLLVREQPDEVAPLVTLGEQLRRAHQDLDGGQLRELSGRQRQLVGALTRQARQLAAEAGHQLGDGTQREIEETLHAVLADADAARIWSEGRLTKPLSGPTGFPGTAPGAAPKKATNPTTIRKRPATGPPPDEREKRRHQELERARREVDDAKSAVRGRQEEADTAARAAEEAAEEAEQATEHATDLAEQLKKAQKEEERARHRERQAKDAARNTDRDLREARHRAETAAAHLQRLSEDDR